MLYTLLVLYLINTENLLQTGTVACSAQHYAIFSCERAFDGVSEGADHQWATPMGTTASIKFIFPEVAVIQYVTLWFRCAEEDQSDVVTFFLSDWTSQQVNIIKLVPKDK